MGIDFDPTFFYHEKAAKLTLSIPDEEIRRFWIRHGQACIRISRYFAEELGQSCVMNIWIPDGYKDILADRLGPRARFKDSLDQILSIPYDRSKVYVCLESKVFGIGLESYTFGSSEFCLNYAAKNGIISLMDNGHYHPTEVVSDKLQTITPEDFRVLTTFAGGRQITDNGKLLVHYETAEHEPCVLNTMHLKNPITADSFKIHAPAGAKKVKALVMDTLPYMPFTNRRDVELPVVDGVVQCDVEQDVLYIAQVERHGKNGNVGKAFMGGFHIRGGAMASSVGHDNHNIIVMGDSFEDMALAVNRCVELGGGQVIVRDGKVAAEVAYPICGLLSDLPLEELAEKKKELNRVAHEMGTEIAIPFMFLSFICLAAIPAYAITDCGFIDVVQQKVIDPILEVVE